MKKKSATPSAILPKLQALRQQGTLHPHPEKVTDPLFRENEFFDPHDGLQVKYEMVRRVLHEGGSVTQTAAAFGFSRPAFYQAQATFQAGGLARLMAHKRGPQRAHKLSEPALSFLDQLQTTEGRLPVRILLQRLQDQFGIRVHRRSLERAWNRRKKKRR
jgi:transposase